MCARIRFMQPVYIRGNTGIGYTPGNCANGAFVLASDAKRRHSGAPINISKNSDLVAFWRYWYNGSNFD